MRKLTTGEFVKRAKKVHGDKYDYSKVKYVNSGAKVCIICPKHGEFWQIANSHLRGQGCPKCGVIARSFKQTKTTEEFIEQAIAVHSEKYDYSKVDYLGDKVKVCIICSEHGEFWMTPHNHIRGQGCPKCGAIKARDSQKLTKDEFIRRAKEVHGNKYDYSKVKYISYHTKVEIICKKHGEFWQSPAHHLRKGGCPKCVGRNKTTEEFIEQAKEVHENKYDYSNVMYTRSEKKVCIICPEHGEFWQTPHKHLSGSGCPECGKYHGKAAYRKAYETKKKNGTFNTSSFEEDLCASLILRYGNTDVVREYNSDVRYPFRCDFYIKSLDLFIELNGHYTHGGHWFDENDEEDIKQLEEWKRRNKSKKYGKYSGAIDVWTRRDVLKREMARKNNLNYVVLWNQGDISQWFEEGCPVRQDWK